MTGRSTAALERFDRSSQTVAQTKQTEPRAEPATSLDGTASGASAARPHDRTDERCRWGPRRAVLRL